MSLTLCWSRVRWSWLVLVLVLAVAGGGAVRGAEGEERTHAGEHGGVAATKANEAEPGLPANVAWTSPVLLGIVWWFVLAILLGPVVMRFQKPLEPEVDLHHAAGAHHADAHHH